MIVANFVDLTGDAGQMTFPTAQDRESSDVDDEMELPHLPLDALLQGTSRMDSTDLLTAASLASSFSDEEPNQAGGVATLTSSRTRRIDTRRGAAQRPNKRAFRSTTGPMSSTSTTTSTATIIPTQQPPDSKRLRSSFAIFSVEKNKQVRETMAQLGMDIDDNSVAQIVADSWQNLEPAERERFQNLALKEKARYDQKTKHLQEEQQRKQNTPSVNVPKSPATAFSEFADNFHAVVKARFPTSSNGEVSKMLANMWKSAPDDTKRQYQAREAARWATYRRSMEEWKRKYSSALREGTGASSGSGFGSNADMNSWSQARQQLAAPRPAPLTSFVSNSCDDDDDDELPEISLDGLQTTYDYPQPILKPMHKAPNFGDRSISGFNQAEPGLLQWKQHTNASSASMQPKPIVSGMPITDISEMNSGINIPSDDSGRSSLSDRVARRPNNQSQTSSYQPSERVGQVTPSQSDIQISLDLEPQPLPPEFDPTPIPQNEKQAKCGPKRSMTDSGGGRKTDRTGPGTSLMRSRSQPLAPLSHPQIPLPVMSMSARGANTNSFGMRIQGLSRSISSSSQSRPNSNSSAVTSARVTRTNSSSPNQIPSRSRSARTTAAAVPSSAVPPTFAANARTTSQRINDENKQRQAASAPRSSGPLAKPNKPQVAQDNCSPKQSAPPAASSPPTKKFEAAPESVAATTVPDDAADAADVSHLDSFNADLDIDDPFEGADDDLLIMDD